MDDYLEINLANWDSRVPHHVREYSIDELLADPAALSHVVSFDLPRLGRLDGLDVVHLQCHIGTDTLSLARLGARSVTGVDFSQPALDAAADVASRAGTVIDYVCSDVYNAVEAVGGARFDLVYTGIGALCWLPDVRRWARTVAALLRPGGRLFIREGHPMLLSLADPRPDGLLVVEFPWFEVPGGTEFVEPNTYVDHDEPLASPRIVSFNHGMGEIVMAVLDAGLHLDLLEEHRSVPWNPLGDAMVDSGGEEYVLRDQPERLAATYTLMAHLP
jgi:2-polyprenyl-3-methyl-5-hydroxy-6-metoxy-1,4-benzoquinol methylase